MHCDYGGGDDEDVVVVDLTHSLFHNCSNSIENSSTRPNPSGANLGVLVQEEKEMRNEGAIPRRRRRRWKPSFLLLLLLCRLFLLWRALQSSSTAADTTCSSWAPLLLLSPLHKDDDLPV